MPQIIESFLMPDLEIVLVHLNGWGMVVSRKGKEIKRSPAMFIKQACDLFGQCIAKVLEGEIVN